MFDTSAGDLDPTTLEPFEDLPVKPISDSPALKGDARFNSSSQSTSRGESGGGSPSNLSGHHKVDDPYRGSQMSGSPSNSMLKISERRRSLLEKPNECICAAAALLYSNLLMTRGNLSMELSKGCQVSRQHARCRSIVPVMVLAN